MAKVASLEQVQFSSGKVDLKPWWVEIDAQNSDFTGPSSDPIEIARFVAAALPKTFAHRAAPDVTYNPPPNTKNAYFPLFEPRFSVERKVGAKLETVSGWEAYFLWNEARSTLHKPPVRIPKLMDLVQMTGELMPGIFLRPDKKFPVIRPRA
jgi:hypothetical protein